MRDISAKIKTLRSAKASSILKASPSLIDKIRHNEVPKGDPLPVAKVAAIQAAKNTSQIIPYCHPIPVDYVSVDFILEKEQIIINVQVKAIYKTGVEMEALTAASVAALTIYDMLKVFDETMEIISTKLITKVGGKSDFNKHVEKKLKIAVLVISDSVAAGKNLDDSGKFIVDRLEQEGYLVNQYKVVPDDEMEIEKTLKEFSDSLHFNLVFTTGGTGLGPRDRTPEVMDRIIDMDVPGIAETARNYGQERMPMAMLSRAKSGMRGKCLLVNLPGSLRAVEEYLDALLPAIFHAYAIIDGATHKREKQHIK